MERYRQPIMATGHAQEVYFLPRWEFSNRQG
jgi:hypothetical protein